MRKFKYLVIDHDGTPVAILFPETESHHRVSALLGYQVLGAGFALVDVEGDHVHYEAMGSSASLKISSRPEDTLIINQQFGGR